VVKPNLFLHYVQFCANVIHVGIFYYLIIF